MHDDVIELGIHRDGVVCFDMVKASNRHISILGRSGSGKSVAGQKILKNLVSNRDCPAIVFDLHLLFAEENLFPEFSKEIKKQSHDIDAYASGITVPLFAPLKHMTGKEEEPLDVTTSIVDVFSNAAKLGARQKACLYDAVDFVAETKNYEKHGIAALDRALNMVDDSRAVAIRDKLRYILRKNVFRDGTIFIQEKTINILRLSRFPESTQLLITEIILTYIWRLANTGAFIEKGLCLYLDECQNLNWGKTGMLRLILSEGRKLGLQLIMITQSLGSSQSDLTHCLLQAANQLYFLPPESEAVTVARLIAPKQYLQWQMRLKSLEVGECVANGTFLVNGALYRGALKIKI